MAVFFSFFKIIWRDGPREESVKDYGDHIRFLRVCKAVQPDFELSFESKTDRALSAVARGNTTELALFVDQSVDCTV